MKNIISTLVLIATLFFTTSCNQVDDFLVSFVGMSVEEALEDVTDEDLIEPCLNDSYLAAVEVTKEECSKEILSKKKVCLKKTQKKWENNMSTKNDLEQMASEYVECLFN